MEKLAEQLQKRALPPVLPAHPASGSMTAEEWKTRKEELNALLAREFKAMLLRLIAGGCK